MMVPPMVGSETGVFVTVQPIASSDAGVTPPVPISRVAQNVTRVSYTVAEAASVTGLPKWTIYSAIHAGELPAKKLGRYWSITPAALAEWVAP